MTEDLTPKPLMVLRKQTSNRPSVDPRLRHLLGYPEDMYRKHV